MQERAETFLQFRLPTPQEQALIQRLWGAEVDRMPVRKGRMERLLGIMLSVFATVYLVREPTEIASFAAILAFAGLLLALSAGHRKNAALKARLQDAVRRGDYLVAESTAAKVWVRHNLGLSIPMVTMAQSGEDYRLPSEFTRLIDDRDLRGTPVLAIQIKGSTRKLAVFRDDLR